MVTDDELRVLLNYLYYHSKHSFVFVFKKTDIPFNSTIEGILVLKGLLMLEPIQPAMFLPEDIGRVAVDVLLHVTRKAQEFVQQLGNEDPVKLAQFYVQLMQFDYAISYIDILSIDQLPVFLTSKFDVIREHVRLRYEVLIDATSKI